MLTDVGGVVAADAVWDQTGSPYNVLSDVTIPAGVTLRIEPGVVVQFQDGTGISVDGRLVAEGTAFERIRFDRAPGESRWDGLSFQDTLADSRIAYTDMYYGDDQGEAINIDSARLFLDNVRWIGTTGTILEMEHPSVIVRNSHFPTAPDGSEIIHGEHVEGNEYLIIEGNVFENSNNGGDVIDILGANRPGPVMQILNNVFLGGGDDALDLDGTDAHIEGNLFMNFRRNTSRPTSSNAIATGLPQDGSDIRTQVTIVRNIFVNNDHAILIKEDAFATIENNVFVGMSLGVFQFHELEGTAVGGPGMGAYLDGNIFHDNAELFLNLVDDGTFRTDLTVNRSLMPNEVVDFDGTPVNAHSLGVGNISGDPMFVDESNHNFRLLPGSPAIGTGPNRIDMGAYVPAGPSIAEVVSIPPGSNDRAFRVAGPGITHYRYRLNGGPYSALRPVSQLIELNDLANGEYQIDVLGMNDAGEWFAGQTPAFGENTVEIIAPTQTRTGEALPIVLRVRDSHGNVNSLLTTPAQLANAGSLNEVDVQVKKGFGSLSPVVTATDDFSLAMGGAFAMSPDRDVEVLDNSFPTQNYTGTLAGNVVWDAATERRVSGMLTVPAGSTLTIEAGTRVLFDEDANLRIEGEIVVEGTAAEPVVFNAIDPEEAWGGLQIVNGTGTIDYAFFTHGGGDESREFGHSDSQPLVFVDGGTLDFENSFIINNTGKAFGSRRDAVIDIHRSVISDVDTGAQFDNSIITVTESIVKNIPNGDGVFDNDDNDGFYFLGVHSSGQPSLFQDSFIVTTKDDGLDHNGARLRVVRAWIEGATHEGIASSNENWVEVEDSVFIGNNQGVEAGYQSPQLNVSNSVLFNNNNRTDPGAPITAGIRFGDGYDGSNGAYMGHITAVNNVVHDNFDNIRNYDGTIPGPQEGAIDITYSMTNDPDYNNDPGNFTGIPVFGPYYHLLRGSAGLFAGSDGEHVGRKLPPVSHAFTVNDPDANLRIDEVVAAGTEMDRIELLNGGGTSIDLGGMSLSNDPADPTRFVFPDATVLEPGDRLVLFADSGSGAGELHVGFELDGAGDRVLLYDTPANGQTVLDSVEFGNQLDGYSIARGAEGNWGLALPTIGEANTQVPTAIPSDLKINEWLAEGDSEFPDDFIELFNPQNLPVDVDGIHLTNNPAQPQLFTFAPLSFIGGRGLLVLTADNDPSAGGDHLNFTLSADGGALGLSEPDGSVLDVVTYGPQTAGVSQGRRPNGGAFIDDFDPPNPGLNNPGDPDGPNAPTNLTATLVSSDQVDLQWDAVVDPDSTVAYYRVYRNGVELTTTTSTFYSDTTVSVGNTYIYEVAGVDSTDVEGAHSTPVSIEVLNVRIFQQGVFPTTSYAGTTDTWIRGTNPNTNYGNDPRMDADGDSSGSAEWALIRWDLSSVPSTETVESASITIAVSDASNDDYGIFALNRNWVESEANWVRYANGANWQSPGTGLPDRGQLIGVLSASTEGLHEVQLNAAGVAIVQSWLDTPSSNFGVIIYSPTATNGLEMRTSEYNTATDRPKLTLGLAAADTTSPTATANETRLDQTDQEIRFQFDEQVQLGTGDLVVRNTTTGVALNAADMNVSFDAITNTAVWTFPGLDRGVLPDGNYVAELVTQEIVDLAGNSLAANEHSSVEFSWFRGDADANGNVEPQDIDTLCASADPTGDNPRLDVDGDGDIDRTDISVLVRDVLATDFGDADLDGAIDANDFQMWNDNRFQEGAGWAGGDFNCDGITDGLDFHIWFANRFQAAQPTAAQGVRTVPRAPLAGGRADAGPTGEVVRAREIARREDPLQNSNVSDGSMNDRHLDGTMVLVRRPAPFRTAMVARRDAAFDTLYRVAEERSAGGVRSSIERVSAVETDAVDDIFARLHNRRS